MSRREGPEQTVDQCYGPNSLQRIRKEHIEEVLRLTGHNLEQTAQILEISMQELRRWMHKLGIA